MFTLALLSVIIIFYKTLTEGKIQMQEFEYDYANLVEEILINGKLRETRNGPVKSLFGKSLVITDIANNFPLIQGRQMSPKGIIGEFAAIIRQPKHIDDFTKWGCNYWSNWCNEDGSLNVDYGNEWFKHGQMDHLKHSLKNNPTDRRMIISGWNPENLPKLNLPCCHYNYQFYVEGKELSMIWTQRSVDTMIGLPSDIVLGALWLITLANEFGYTPGVLKMDLGDCHIYQEHLERAQTYIARVDSASVAKNPMLPVGYMINSSPGKPFEEFEPTDLHLALYPSFNKLNFLLKA